MILITISTVSAGFDPVRPNKDYWTCYDYSIDYARNNPEWGIVTMSDNPIFHGISHMVNYKFENGIMYIHDGSFNEDYTFSNWNESNTYFHFWNQDQTPIRNYIFLTDNRDVVL